MTAPDHASCLHCWAEIRRGGDGDWRARVRQRDNFDWIPDWACRCRPLQWGAYQAHAPRLERS